MASTAPDTSEPPPISERAALLSIAGFWLFYYAVVTLRAAALGFEDQIGMLGRRLLVTVASMAITYLIYRLLARTAGSGLRRQVAAAALLSIPGAFLYATANHYAFYEANAQQEAKAKDSIVIDRPPSAPSVPPIPRPERDPETGITPPAPPAPPAPPRIVIRNQGVNIQIGGSDETEAPSEEHYAASPLAKITDQAANGYFFFAAWAALFLALSYAAQVRAAERQAARFRTAAQAAELRALRYQVNPHFLFNTLNSLSSLVLADRRDEAERMIMNLATFFRTSLAGDPTEDVVLSEEIRLQRLYLDIEAVRFPERLSVVVDVPDDLLDACVPGLILQPLVENAIKHGVSGARRPVTIRISARADGRCLVLRVEDDGDAAAGEGSRAGHGVGLRNVRDRLAARFGKESDCLWGPLPEGGFAVRLYMPLVRHDC